VKNADDAVYADADFITLINNAMMHLFSNIKNQLWLPIDSMRLDTSPANEKFHLAIAGEISPGEASLDNRSISDR